MQGWCEDHHTVRCWAKEGCDDPGESLCVPCGLRDTEGRCGGEKLGTWGGAGLRKVGMVSLSYIQPLKLRDPNLLTGLFPDQPGAGAGRCSDSDSLDWEEGDKKGKTMGV